jgi:hypothetical protein
MRIERRDLDQLVVGDELHRVFERQWIGGVSRIASSCRRRDVGDFWS